MIIVREEMLVYSCIQWTVSLLLVSCCINVSADSHSSEEDDCDSPWERLHRTCVQFIKEKPLLNWQQGREYCELKKSDLLSINSQKENKNIKALIKYHVNDSGLSEWWIGLRQVIGVWQWVDSEEVYAKIPMWSSASGRHFYSSEDSNGLSEDYCAVIDDKGKLREKQCVRERRPFICEKLPAFSTSTPRTTQYTKTKIKTTTEITISTTSPQTTNTPITGGGESKSTKTTPYILITRTQPAWRPQTERSTELTTTRGSEEKFVGCYAVNYEDTCPPVEAFGIYWPRTRPGTMALVKCEKGNARWKCDKEPTCWREEPDVKQCTSENIQKLITQANEFLANPEDFEMSMTFSNNLAATANVTEEMSEQDVYQTTKLMKEVSNAKPRNSKEAKSLIKNVAMCGNALVRKDRKKTWSSMSMTSKRNIASSLLNSMESVTNKMMKSFHKPTVENIVEDNMAIELQVINVTAKPVTDDPKFESDSNSFTIPSNILKKINTDDLARVVFINYNTVGPLLTPDNVDVSDDLQRTVVSSVVSASIITGIDDGSADKPDDKKLTHPLTFTLKVSKQASNREVKKQLCSFWNFDLGFSGAWSQEGCSLKESNDTHVTCQCDHLTNFAILMDVHSTPIQQIHAVTLSYITYVGLIISSVCLFLTWITFTCLSIRCIRDKRRTSLGQGDGHEYYGQSGSYTGSTAGSRSAQGERNSIHKNLAFCLFIAEVLFICGIQRTDNTIACAVIAGCLHYFFLSSFTWMFVEGIHILFMLVQVFDAARSRLRYYYAIGYGAPSLVVGISSLVYYEGYGTSRYCWLTTGRMFIWSFAGPVAFILLVNLVILIYAMSTVCKHSDYVFDKDKSMFGSFKAWIQGALAMEILLGLTWVFGYFYITEEAIPVAYFFTIFNSLQGLFIFIFHCILNKKVRGEYMRFFRVQRYAVGSPNSSRGSHQIGLNPRKKSNQIPGTRKQSELIVLEKDRRPSSRSTTSA